MRRMLAVLALIISFSVVAGASDGSRHQSLGSQAEGSHAVAAKSKHADQAKKKHAHKKKHHQKHHHGAKKNVVKKKNHIIAPR